MNNVAGISQTKAKKKSTDMLMKCKYMQEINDGKGVVFATGNTYIKLYDGNVCNAKVFRSP